MTTRAQAQFSAQVAEEMRDHWGEGFQVTNPRHGIHRDESIILVIDRTTGETVMTRELWE